MSLRFVAPSTVCAENLEVEGVDRMMRVATKNLRGAMIAGIFACASPLLLGSSCESSEHFPVGDQQELARDLVSVCAAYGVAHPAPFTYPASPPLLGVPGDVTPPAAASCVDQLLEAGRVQLINAADLPSYCRSGTALACTIPNYSGCADDVCLPDDLVPTNFLDNVSTGNPYRSSIVDAMMILCHEAVHTVQTDRFGDCQRVADSSPAGEVEAYVYQASLATWVRSQLVQEGARMAPFTLWLPTRPHECRPFNDYVIDPVITSLIAQYVPGFDPSQPIPEPQCSQLAGQQGLLNNFTIYIQEGDVYASAFRRSFSDCATSSLETSDTRRPLPAVCPDRFVSSIAGSNVLYQYQRDAATGDLTQEKTWSLTSLGQIRSVEFIEEPASFVMVVTGDGGTVIRIRDDGMGGGTAGDCIYDAAAVMTSDSRVREGTRIVLAGSRPPLLWDGRGQRAFRFYRDANGYLAGLSATVALDVPTGREISSIAHSVEYPMVVATGGSVSSDSNLLRFEDPSEIGVYALVAEGTPQEVGPYPATFPIAPAVGQTMTWVAGQYGHTVEVLPVDASGAATGSALGSAVIPASGIVRVSLSRALVANELVRPVDTVSGLDGAFPAVAPIRPRVFVVDPPSGVPAGGTRVTLRGSGLAGIGQIQVAGVVATGLSIVDDETVSFLTPSSAAAAGEITAITTSGPHVVGNFVYDANIVASYSGAALSTWTTSGSGWTCGSNVLASGSEPMNASRDGCQYAGAAGTWGDKISPSITLPAQQGPFAIRILHRGGFGTDGDGVVLVAHQGTTSYPLVPRDDETRRVHAASCSGTSSRVCSMDPPAMGLAGFSGAAVPTSWRVSTFDLPAALNGGGTITLRVAATNVSSTSAASYSVARVEVIRLEAQVGDRVESAWTTLSSFDGTCSGVTLAGYFTCSTSFTGATGAVLRYFASLSSGSTGSASIPVAMSGLSGREVTAVVRHRVDMMTDPYVGTGLGRAKVCCGASCQYAVPAAGYPQSPPGVTNAFTDEGPDGATWMIDEFDISAFAGNTGACSLRFEGQGQVSSSRPGWVIDSVTIRWR